jgi:hypothetical protein
MRNESQTRLRTEGGVHLEDEEGGRGRGSGLHRCRSVKHDELFHTDGEKRGASLAKLARIDPLPGCAISRI